MSREEKKGTRDVDAKKRREAETAAKIVKISGVGEEGEVEEVGKNIQVCTLILIILSCTLRCLSNFDFSKVREIVEGDVEESKGSQKSRSVGLGKIHGDPEIVAQRVHQNI